ncbi:MAG: 1-acyl-sn-glycerol-3-phosphate acyltransferase [SAR202 cluster bacterium]|nr:1-acyl-sn-glycerol-3-phosphate acyltransferase [SAR202 cluster bacterium]
MPDKVYRISRAVEGLLIRTLSRWRVEGVENVPPRGPLIVVANHLSNMDPPLLMCSIPRRLHFLAKRGLFKPGLSQFFSAFGAYPVDLEAAKDMKGFNWCRRLLERDGTICIFPEGTRHRTGGMHKAIPGVALLALRTQAPILPVGITGTAHIGAIWQVFVPTGDITVRIGRVFSLPNVEGRLQRAQLDSFTTQVMQRIAMLLPREYQGVYALAQSSPSPEGRSTSLEGAR